MSSSKVLAVIPARRGSKGLPGKNTKILNGKPLIAYSIEAAKAAGLDLIVASDDPQVLAIAQDFDIDTSYKRPESVSTDKTSMGETLLDVVAWAEAQGKSYESLVLLQPTSPFRTAYDIRQGLALHAESGGKHVLGVSPMWTHPYECVQVAADGNWSFLAQPAAKVLRRQEYSESFYFINGAFYCFRIQQLKELGQVPFLDAKLLKMDAVNTVDIDTQLEFTIAEALMSAKA